MKLTIADQAFSLCVRERADWCCERCHRPYPDRKGAGLHCSHYFGRRNHAVRYDPLNAACLCFGCHNYADDNHHIYAEWKHWQLDDLYDLLVEHANDTTRGKKAHKEVQAIAAHYRRELERMLEQRAAGITGRIEFADYF